MPKFNKLRSMVGNGELQWVNQIITCAVVSGYTFDATHQSLNDILTAGGTVLATSKLPGKAVTADGSAQSLPTPLRLVPTGGPYDVIIFATVNNNITPLVFYDNAVTLLATSDVTIRPSGVTTGAGTWFRF